MSFLEECTARDRGCKTCKANNKAECKECVDNWVLNEESGRCIPCDHDNCAECDQDGKCIKCKDNFFVNKDDGSCDADCTIADENCLECDEKQPTECAACKKESFVGAKSGTCRRCRIHNCEQCKVTDEKGNTCEKCKEGFFVNKFDQCQENCISLDKNCVKCQEDDQADCEECADTHFLQVEYSNL